MSTFQSLPGFREFYPEDCSVRNGLFAAWRGAAQRFRFAEYDAPVLEPLELYLEKSGEEIRSQLFEFEDKGGRKVALRPEMTPTLARLVAARAGSLRKPVKWFSIGEQFRYEKPQKGRLRSFYQFNADILGEPGPAADAECIALLIDALRSCGLKEGDFVVRISDRQLWFLLFASFGVQEDQIPQCLAIIDKWEREALDDIEEKLKAYIKGDIEKVSAQIHRLMNFEADKGYQFLLNNIEAGNRDFYVKLEDRFIVMKMLMEHLNAMGLKNFYKIDFHIVRGLAYYTGFVFEAFQTVGTARALAGGGRYDDLLKKLCGVDMPAVGFAIGDVTVTDLLTELKRLPADASAPDVYLVIGGDDVRPAALQLVSAFRAAGLAVDYPLKDEKFGKQFKAADQCGARLAVVLGTEEAGKGVVKIKDLKSGEETTLPNDSSLAGTLKARLAPQ